MPLEEALRYILKTQELIYRIEEDAVWVATKEEMDNEQVETRIYFPLNSFKRKPCAAIPPYPYCR